MKKVKIGTVTIGQSPRTDIMEEIIPFLGDGFEIIEKGALDGMSKEFIRENISPKWDQPVGDIQVSRLASGDEVTIDKSKMMPYLYKKIEELNEEQVDLIVLLCNDPFPEIKSTVQVIRPESLIHNIAVNLSSSKKVGIVMPNESQLERAKILLSTYGLDATVVAVSPYQDAKHMEHSLEPLLDEEIDLIILECLGNGLDFKNRVIEHTGKKVILVREMLFSIVKVLF